MLQTITTNLSQEAYHFIKEVSKNTKKTHRQIIEEALEMYKQYYLEQEIKKWFESRKEEYLDNLEEYKVLQSVVSLI